MTNAVLAASSTNVVELATWQVVVLGMGIVFLGLICIIILCTITGKLIPMLENMGKKEVERPAPSASVVTPAASAIPNRQELVAAISCVLAEEMGTDVSAIRIVSLKKI